MKSDSYFAQCKKVLFEISKGFFLMNYSIKKKSKGLTGILFLPIIMDAD